jgi:hypothetical protein
MLRRVFLLKDAWAGSFFARLSQFDVGVEQKVMGVTWIA